MNSEKMLYWVTLAVMGLFVGNHFAIKHQGNSLADRAMATVQHLGAEATHFTAMAESMFSGTSSFGGSEEAFAKMQSHWAYVQSSLAREQAACARQQARQARMVALQQVEHLRIVCPRQNITIKLPGIPEFVSE